MAFDAEGIVRPCLARNGETSPLRAPSDSAIDWNKSDTATASAGNPGCYLERLFLPLWQEGDVLVIALADATAEKIAWLRAAYGAIRLIAVSKEDLLAAIHRRFAAHLTEDAISALSRERPELSAQRVVTGGQGAVLILILIVIGVTAAGEPAALARTLVAAMSLLFWLSVVFRAALALTGAGRQVSAMPKAAGRDDLLPSYSVIVPLYREAHMVPVLARSLLALDYPHDRLQIILAVESDDAETVNAVEPLDGVTPFEVVRVPPSFPRTKPKAANYALRFARGEFAVVYDAEDRPQSDQLRKAVCEFRRQPRTTACLQARLVFDNAHCWIARQAALDYALWFGLFLPGLDRLGAPMPLGGTSNHFRTSVLRAVHAWDPFNVAEDADMGIRLAALGYRVAMLDSTTFEEAPERVGAWIRQRSRWLKGYMQTWLVHTRCASHFVGQTGLRGFVTFHFFVGGTIVSALLNPILWAICISFAIVGQHSAAYVSAGGIVASNGVLTVLAMTGTAWRGDGRLSPHGIVVPLYWLLISLAAWRALLQLIINPFHWEKTAHGGCDHV